MEDDTVTLIERLEELVSSCGETDVQEKSQIYWDLGFAWAFSGENLAEIEDVKKGILYFSKAASLGCSLPEFWIDYGEAYLLLAEFQRKSEYLNKAIDFFKKGIVDSFHHEIDRLVYKRGFKLYLKSFKKKILWEEVEIEEIDPLFFEAISSMPEDKDLWLEWTEIYFHMGWIKKDISLVEKGLEKLSFFNDASLLFCEGLLMMGLFLDDYRLIFEGKKRLRKLAPQKNSSTFYAFGLSSLVSGIYFSDVKELKKAVSSFKKAIALNQFSFLCWHGLFETYLAIAVLKKEKRYFVKALTTINYLLLLHPESSLMQLECALLFMQWGEIEIKYFEKSLNYFRKASKSNGKIDPLWLYYFTTTLDRCGQITGKTIFFEEGIDILTRHYETTPHLNIIYRLAFLFSHFGQKEKNIHICQQALKLFEIIAKKKQEDDVLFYDWGALLLHLSISDPEMSLHYRSMAETKLIKALELGHEKANFELACLYSLNSSYDLSLFFLKRAVKLGLFSHWEKEEKLEGVKQTEGFKNSFKVKKV